MTDSTGGSRVRDWPSRDDLEIETLGPPCLPGAERWRQRLAVDETDRVLLPSSEAELEPFRSSGRPLPSFEPAGPRAKLFFDASRIACGIVTCGGLCPGLNNVVRAVVLHLTYAYGAGRILGFRYGYEGLAAEPPEKPLELTAEAVESLQEHGGTLLGSSRGPQDTGEMVDTLVAHGVGILFVVGGDGGLKGASAIAAEIRRRGLPIAVIGVPKTIDNDLEWTWRSFGFATAVEEAHRVILGAHAEALGARDGIGLVKLMGRHSGFIAAHATLASADVNFCLVPEVPFTLKGKGGLLDLLERRLGEKRHAVIVVAEGAGQELLQAEGPPERDASGNVKLRDIGVFLRDEIAAHFAGRGKPVPIRYIDPSYTIRSLPANSFDAQLCLALGQHAVNAGMAGRTDMFVGTWNQRFTHVPIRLGIASRKRLDPCGEAWQRVLDTTGQPPSMVGRG
jgi:6-phosphofructokinase 1